MKHIRQRPINFPKQLLKLPKSVKMIALLMFIYFIGWGIVNPFLPIYFHSILGNYQDVGIIFGLLYLFSAIFSLFFGYLSDKIDKKKLIFIALLLYLPLSSIILSLRKMMDFILYRFYHGFISSLLWVPAEVHIREHSPKHKTAEAMGLFDVAWVLSSIIGSIIGGFLILKFGFNLIYTVSIFAVLAIIPLFFVKTKKRNTPIRDIKFDLKKEFRHFFREKELVKLSFVNFLVHFCYIFLFMILPLFLKELNASLLQIGLIYGAAFVPFLFESYFSVLADKTGKKKVLLKGILFGTIFFFGMFFVKGIFLLFLFSLLLSASFAAIIPSLFGRMTELMPKKEIGELTGINRALANTAGGTGLILSGIIAGAFGLRYVFLLGFGVFFLLYFIVLKIKFGDQDNL